MKIINFLDETKQFLSAYDKTLQDIKAIRTNEGNVKDIKKFFKFMDFEYNCDFGMYVIPLDLILIGNDFWLERYEYDGSEEWRFKSYPTLSDQTKDIVLNSDGEYIILEKE